MSGGEGLLIKFDFRWVGGGSVLLFIEQLHNKGRSSCWLKRDEKKIEYLVEVSPERAAGLGIIKEMHSGGGGVGGASSINNGGATRCAR